MKQTTQRFIVLALIALLALFAGCKGESPTAPPPITGTSGNGTGGGSGSGTQPPVGASIALAATTSTPFTGSTSTITATVTQDSVVVPNGTAVEFSTATPNAHFIDTSDNPTTLIRTTTTGIAKATVTSSTAGPVVVKVTVNNVTKSITVTFQDPVIPPVPTPTNPTISSITPPSGLPTGNQSIIITGTNFRTPVRVIFDPGNGQTPKDGFVTSVTPTQITVITPAFDLGVSQQLIVSITVISEAGLPTEQRVTKAAAFTYTAPVLTPVVRAVSPTAGPIGGGTRITIIGDAFEAPVQVFFGSAQAQILSVTFHEIDVISPTARDTNPNGSGTVTGPIDIKVLNVNSGKSVVATAAFRYTPKMQITTAQPTFGSAFGGTRITIDGTGFADPLAVTVAGIPASVIKVSGTEVVVITGHTPVPCSPPIGPIVITNSDNGDFDSALVFTYSAEKPAITNINPTSGMSGSSLQVTVVKPGVGLDGTALIRFKIGATSVSTTPNVISDPAGPTTFTLTVPTQTLPDLVCTTPGGLAGTKKGPVVGDLTFLNVTTGCTDVVTGGFTVTPDVASATCTATPTQPPPAVTVTPNPLCPVGTTTVATSINGLLTVKNTAAAGAQTLNVSNIVVTGPNAGDFTVSPATLAVAPGGAAGITVTFKPSATGLRNATITIFTNDPSNSTITVPVCGTGS